MEKFSFLFGVVLGKLLLSHADNLSKSLQVKTLTAIEGQEQAKLTIKTLQSIRTEEMYDLFWTEVTKVSDDLNVDEPCLPRSRKRQRRHEIGSAEPEFSDSPKDYYRAVYFEALDLIVSSITQRFDQQGF